MERQAVHLGYGLGRAVVDVRDVVVAGVRLESLTYGVEYALLRFRAGQQLTPTC